MKFAKFSRTPFLIEHLQWLLPKIQKQVLLQKQSSGGVLINFAKFTGKHLCQSQFFNKVAGLWHRCFPVNFAKFLRTPFLTSPLVAASVQYPRFYLDKIVLLCNMFYQGFFLLLFLSLKHNFIVLQHTSIEILSILHR